MSIEKPEGLQISYLADHPQHLAQVVAWVFEEWGRHIPGVTLEKIEARFSNHLHRNALPLTLLALMDGQAAGTASLQTTDMYTHPELTPWLAAVYVPPAHRRLGIGSELVQAAEAVSRRIGVRRLYLFTPDRERFYARLGWSVLERTGFRHQPVVIMRKSFLDLPKPSDPPNR